MAASLEQLVMLGREEMRVECTAKRRPSGAGSKASIPMAVTDFDGSLSKIDVLVIFGNPKGLSLDQIFSFS